MADIMLGQLLHRPTIDPISESSPLPVQLSGSLLQPGFGVPRLTQVAVETIVNAQTIAAGAYVTASWDYKGESETRVVVSIDQQPWSLKIHNFPLSTATGGATATFPNLYPDQTTVPSAAYPVVATLTRAACTTLTEAALNPAVGSGAACRITNGSAGTATCTLKIIRIWR